MINKCLQFSIPGGQKYQKHCLALFQLLLLVAEAVAQGKTEIHFFSVYSMNKLNTFLLNSMSCCIKLITE